MRRLLIACLVLLLPACGGKGSPTPDATPTENSYLSHRGEVLPLRSALGQIAFRPFVPAREIVETALLPAYNGGADERQNRGIGFEYISKREAFVLSQWPGSGMPGPRNLGTIEGCLVTGYDIAGGVGGKQGALWSNGRIVSDLVAAGNATNRETFEEARRLVRRGACR
jgi:hypothetical protein